MSLNQVLCFDEVGLRNFMSYGNNDTVINLVHPGTTLIVGEDLDSGTGTSNGAGKSTILNALVYALFDRPLSKDIKLDELINNVNKKNMEVYVKFHKGNTHYKIVRQRKGRDGNTVQLWINDELKTLDSIDQTNKFIIEKIIGYSYDVFVRIVVFSANHEPFFSLPTSGSSQKVTQTDIIEELFSLTSLTIKATLAKADIKENEQKIELIKAKLEYVEAEQLRHAAQLASVKQRATDWTDLHDLKVEKAQATIDNGTGVDFVKELENWQNLVDLRAQSKQLHQIYTRLSDWQSAHDKKMVTVMREHKVLKGIDFEGEIALHQRMHVIGQRDDALNSVMIRRRTWDLLNKDKVDALVKEWADLQTIDFPAQFALFETIADLETIATSKKANQKALTKELGDLEVQITQQRNEHEQLSDAKCPYCLQDFHGAQEKLVEIVQTLADLQERYEVTKSDLDSINLVQTLSDIDTSTAQLVVPSLAALNKKAAYIESLNQKMQDAIAEKNPHLDTLAGLMNMSVDAEDLIEVATKEILEIGIEMGKLHPTTPDERTVTRMQTEFISLSKRLAEMENEVNPNLQEFAEYGDGEPDEVFAQCDANLTKQIECLEELVTTPNLSAATRLEQEYTTALNRLIELQAETNPFTSTLEELEAVKLDDTDYDEINKLKKVVDHQKMLVKLLTKSDSFVRKALIEQNVPLLNEKLGCYLKELGLPHKVEFTNTMSAAITQLGRPLNFNNLSTGQKARVNLALSWAFRDVLQKMHSKVNFCLLDEVLDVGLCAYGISAAAKMLKAKARKDGITMFIISHRDELNSTFDRNMKVLFHRGFSRIEEDEE